MATRSYPSKKQPSGKAGSFPSSAPSPTGTRPGRIDDVNDPYRYRPEMGRDMDEIYRNRRNDYGKKPQPGRDEMPEGIPVMPRIINGI